MQRLNLVASVGTDLLRRYRRECLRADVEAGLVLAQELEGSFVGWVSLPNSEDG
jgi:hypothetical protein